MHKNNHYLDAVMRARTAYLTAKATLESKLREQLDNEMNNLQTQVDIAVRYAFDNGASKSSILRAMGTKDFYTVQKCLDRTDAVNKIEAEDTLRTMYAMDDTTGQMWVRYDNHGPLQITGDAVFDVRVLDDKTTWFMSASPLWNEDYSVRNDVVAALDGKQDGYYYEEAKAWLDGKL